MLDIDDVLINTSDIIKEALDEVCLENELPKLNYISGLPYKNWSNMISKLFMEKNQSITSDDINSEIIQKIQYRMICKPPDFNDNLANEVAELKEQGHFCSLITNNSIDMVDFIFQLYPNFSSALFDTVITNSTESAKPSPNAYFSAIESGPDNVNIIGFEHSVAGIFGFLKATSMYSSKLFILVDEPNIGLEQYVNKIAPSRDISFTAVDWSNYNSSAPLNRL